MASKAKQISPFFRVSNEPREKVLELQSVKDNPDEFKIISHDKDGGSVVLDFSRQQVRSLIAGLQMALGEKG